MVLRYLIYYILVCKIFNLCYLFQRGAITYVNTHCHWPSHLTSNMHTHTHTLHHILVVISLVPRLLVRYTCWESGNETSSKVHDMLNLAHKEVKVFNTTFAVHRSVGGSSGVRQIMLRGHSLILSGYWLCTFNSFSSWRIVTSSRGEMFKSIFMIVECFTYV